MHSRLWLGELSPSSKMLAPETHGTPDTSSGGQAGEFLKGQRGWGALAGGSVTKVHSQGSPAPPRPAGASAPISAVLFRSVFQLPGALCSLLISAVNLPVGG